MQPQLLRSLEHAPLSGSQESVEHANSPLQSFGAPMQVASTWHASAKVHSLPSSHTSPGAGSVEQLPDAVSQLSVVHGLPSSQSASLVQPQALVS